ncbi:hypothetical protein EVAR_9568_1 [Eumeta japonica]|uniref:Uncharacterized protein n=1 Tax=Eumeta variegata TaxID=151549 RepID=A0A4C1U4T9_EUMVA|nr:hypothetical protein EVAR_9568_1 [Eumeta japonica]
MKRTWKQFHIFAQPIHANATVCVCDRGQRCDRRGGDQSRVRLFNNLVSRICPPRAEVLRTRDDPRTGLLAQLVCQTPPTIVFPLDGVISFIISVLSDQVLGYHGFAAQHPSRPNIVGEIASSDTKLIYSTGHLRTGQNYLPA